MESREIHKGRLSVNLRRERKTWRGVISEGGYLPKTLRNPLNQAGLEFTQEVRLSTRRKGAGEIQDQSKSKKINLGRERILKKKKT